MGKEITYIDSLAKKNSEALSFIPRPRLEKYLVSDQVIMATENGEPAGFLIYGSTIPFLRIYQACVQYDARRREQGFEMVRELIARGERGGATYLSLSIVPTTWRQTFSGRRVDSSFAGSVKEATDAPGGTTYGDSNLPIHCRQNFSNGDTTR